MADRGVVSERRCREYRFVHGGHALRVVDRVAARVAIGGDLEPEAQRAEAGPPVETVKKGMRVWVPRLRAEAEIVEVMGGEVRVQAGAMKLVLPLAELRAKRDDSEPKRKGALPSKGGDPGGIETPIMTSVYQMLHEGKPPLEVVQDLMTRSPKRERL